MAAKSKTKSVKTTSADTTLMILAAVAALLVGAFSVVLYKNKSTMQIAPQAKTMTIALTTQNNSYEQGTATLTEKDGKTVVTLDIQGAPKGISQPAHIHVGSCPNPGAVKYPLASVVDGKSETTIDTTIDQLKEMGKLAINVHKSATLSKVYVACGDLKF